MPEVVLRPSRRKLIFLLLVAMAFVAIGVIALREGDLGVGLSCTIFFGLCAVAFAIQLRSGSAYLRLTQQGFVVCSVFRASPIVGWHQVHDFRVESLPPHGHKMVVYDSDIPSSQGMRKLNRALVGASDGLPDTYGMKAAELADLMNTWRERYAAAD